MTDQPADPLAFLSDYHSTPAPVDTSGPTAATTADAEPQSPERDAQGRFLPKAGAVDPEPAPAPVTVSVEPAPQGNVTAPAPWTVPGQAMLEEREKRQAAEAKLAELERQSTARPTTPAPRRPDPETDLAGATAYDVSTVRQEIYASNLRMSRRFAERQYGPELVKTVHEWANERTEPASPKFDPHFNAQVASSEDPYETIMQAYNRDRVLTTVKPEQLDAFQQWLATQSAPADPAAAAAAPPPAITPSAPPPRTLASAPSASSGAGKPVVPDGPGEAYRSAFG